MKWPATFAAVATIPLSGHALAPASSLTVGRLSERDDVLRAVNLLVGRIYRTEHAETSNPHSSLQYDQFKMFSHNLSDAVIVTSPHAASEHDPEKISSQVSAPESIIQAHSSPDPMPDSPLVENGQDLLSHLPPILEASHQLAAKVIVSPATERSKDEQSTVIATGGPDEKFATDGNAQALLSHLPPILEASHQLAAKAAVAFEEGPSAIEQDTSPEEPTLASVPLSDRDDVLRAVDLLMGRTDKSDQLVKSSAESSEALLSAPRNDLEKPPLPGSALESTLKKYGKLDQRSDGALSNDLSPLLEASPDEAAEVDALLKAVSSTDRGMVCEPGQRSQVEKLIAGLEARAVDQNALESEWLCQRSEVSCTWRDEFKLEYA